MMSSVGPVEVPAVPAHDLLPPNTPAQVVNLVPKDLLVPKLQSADYTKPPEPHCSPTRA
ncbi:hypothetical protein CCYS_13250 [Corynebacterium cystitidis DSM 20524]|uniref:Uncharacterized protein n=1 Tax=Corynebacterium cystitidis DSM 20524 TaxID=1121357 RepID=A0A1H9TAQ2_9CORY|nr:hypothetical protein CCYS_13250 [Corynebacterium cystitidis DSM 20524]SER94302.1 hypothetical protein SAMN05661109_01390 [Corynebacterium cystitidis DSM 20524]SNV92246.1 Uncharacterised protein [Corynebacterium cystitidis]